MASAGVVQMSNQDFHTRDSKLNGKLTNHSMTSSNSTDTDESELEPEFVTTEHLPQENGKVVPRKRERNRTLKSLKRLSGSHLTKRSSSGKSDSMTDQKLRLIDSKEYEKEPFLFLFSSREVFDVLKNFLEYEYNAENMEFVSSVLDYEALTNKEKRLRSAKNIYDVFVDSKSPKQVNLSEKTRKLVEENLSSSKISQFIFEEAKQEALKMMKLNSFPRFSSKVSTTIKESWSRITSKFDAQTVGNIFYEELFKTVPALKALFVTNSPHIQSTMFVSMISNCITVLDDLTKLIPNLATLSVRHRQYGCHTGQFFITGQVLITVLSIAEGNNWNDDLKDAWVCVYTLIAVVMKQYLPDPPPEEGVNDDADKCTLL
eukprot:Pgem_evm1s10172